MNRVLLTIALASTLVGCATHETAAVTTTQPTVIYVYETPYTVVPWMYNPYFYPPYHPHNPRPTQPVHPVQPKPPYPKPNQPHNNNR